MRSRLMLSTALVLLLAGCGMSTQAAPSEDEGSGQTAAVSPSAAETVADDGLTAHGWTAAEAGHDLSLDGADGEEIASITLEQFKPVTCDSSVFPGAENGQVIAATVNVKLSSDEIAGDIGQMIGNATSWRAYDSEGQRVNSLSTNAIYNCLNNRNSMLPMDLSAGESATGDVLLDIPDNVESIAWVYPTEEVGFEWPYNSKASTGS